MNNLFDFQLEYTGGGVRELDRQLALLLSTREGSVPLDREFGLDLNFVDMPASAVKALYTAEVTKKVAKFIPSVRVLEVTWTGTMEGQLKPKVEIPGA